MKFKISQSCAAGFTLIEIIVVSVILVIVLVGFLGVFILGITLNESSKHLVTAVYDACSVLEDIRSIDPFDTASILAAYPDSGTVSGYNNLSQETVRVDYASVAADPLHITVTVTWQEKNRNRSVSVVTLMTER